MEDNNNNKGRTVPNNLISEGEIIRRFDRLDKQTEELTKATNELMVSNTRIANTLETLNNLGPRVQLLEDQMNRNSAIMTSVKWLGMTIAGSAIVVIVTSILQNIQ